MVIRHRRLNFGLDQTWVSSEEGQLRRVEHLLFFFNLFSELMQTLTVQGSKAHVLSAQAL